MACPFTACSLQARAELLACVSSVYAVLREQLAAEDVRRFLRWLERFSRYPVGLEDSSTIHFSSIGRRALEGLVAPPLALPACAWCSKISHRLVVGVLAGSSPTAWHHIGRCEVAAIRRRRLRHLQPPILPFA